MKNFNHAVDFRCRVVKIETRASRPGQTKPPHQRLIAMVSAAHRQPVLIRERGKIVRMRGLHYETDKRATVSTWSKDAHPGQFSETFHRVTGKLCIVLENR